VRYVSTRGLPTDQPVGFCDILLEGLAPDGGLYWPETFPPLDRGDRAELRRMYAERGYPHLAWAVLSRYIDDIPSADLLALCQRAYAPATFGGTDTIPVSRLDDDVWLAHLSNGPTAAFKDVAMQLLAELFEYELGRRGQRLVIVGATSGDTGSAAEFALRGRARLQVFMLSPQGRMTDFQRGQMYGLDDPHIVNVTVPGSFDDCQDLVKQVNADADFKTRHSLGAVNSINWARLIAQTVYYVAAWLQVARDDDAPVDFCVPTGNFGNILAGHVARQMGLPINRLIVASNENDVLPEFFDTGVYRVRSSAETVPTSSPSMDISKASNFERFLFDLLDRDAAEVARLFGRVLPADGVFDLGDAAVRRARDRFGFGAGRSSHADRVATIRRLHEERGVLIDPHTADGVAVGRRTLGESSGGAPMICLETALPIKFATTITEAIGRPAPVPERFAGVLDAPSHTVDLGPSDGVARLKEIIEDHLAATGWLA